MFRVISAIILFLIAGSSASPQQVDYRALFNNDWEKAVTFERENNSWMAPLLEKYDIPYGPAIAVIFPELVRYSALRDRMEITLLKTLYINLGEEYANFSVGVFQMKPSFAESIISKMPSKLRRKGRLELPSAGDYADVREFRKKIVSDMEKPERQLIYLIAFIKICEAEYGLNNMEDIDNLKFISTAYNCGLGMSRNEIGNMADRRFVNTKLFGGEKYSYSDVSVSWYRRYLEEDL